MKTENAIPPWCDPALSLDERIAALNWRPTVARSGSWIDGECKLCGSEYDSRMACIGPDRYGFPCSAWTCDNCGVRYLWPRMSDEDYERFYADGTYRRLVSAYHGRDVMATIEAEQAEYGERLAGIVPHIPHARRLLDIGGSTGVVARQFHRWYADLDCDVLDPAYEGHGGDYIHFSSIEHFQSRFIPYDIILLCQTIDHLCDPVKVFKNVRDWLAPGGMFFFDILDWTQETAQKGIDQTVKVDHPFYFTDESVRWLIQHAGFTLVESWESGPNHIGYLCKV